MHGWHAKKASDKSKQHLSIFTAIMVRYFKHLLFYYKTFISQRSFIVQGSVFAFVVFCHEVRIYTFCQFGIFQWLTC